MSGATTARGRGPAEADPRVTAAEAGGAEEAGLLTTAQAPALEVTLGTEARVREATLASLTTPVSARLGPVVRAGPPTGDTSGAPEERTATNHMPESNSLIHVP